MSYNVTGAAIRQAVIDQARREVGKHFGVGNVTPYGKWYGPGWERALFCAAGWSWSWYQALGADEANRCIGYQRYGGTAPMRRGYVWTVGLLKDHEHHKVSLRNLKPGDALLSKYPTVGSRNTNVVNHVDVVEYNSPSGGYLDVIGFNTPRPGAPAGTDQSRGGGVWRRRVWYTNRYIVAGLQMPAEEVAEGNRRGWSRVQNRLHTLGYGDFMETGTPGPATRAAVANYTEDYNYRGAADDQVALLAHMEETMSKLDDILTEVRAVREAVDKVPAQVWTASIPFVPGTSLHDVFGDRWRAGALLGYAGVITARDDIKAQGDRIIDELSPENTPD